MFERASEVEAHFRQHHAAEMIRRGQRFVVPGPVSQTMEGDGIKRWIREAWDRESRFPLKMSVTLRLAFRHMGLHIFKTSGGGTFITSVYPAAMDPEQAVPVIREILKHLAAAPRMHVGAVDLRSLSRPSVRFAGSGGGEAADPLDGGEGPRDRIRRRPARGARELGVVRAAGRPREHRWRRDNR